MSPVPSMWWTVVCRFDVLLSLQAEDSRRLRHPVCNRNRRIRDDTPPVAGPPEGMRSGAGLQPGPAYLGIFLTDHVPRSGLISMDHQAAIVTVQHMPWGTHASGTSTCWAVARCPAFAHTLSVDANTLQCLRHPGRHRVKRPETV